MPDIAACIARYHDLLTDQVAADSQAELDRQTGLHGLYFGTRPVCSVLRPRFLTLDQYQFLRRSVQSLLPAFRKTYEVALADPDFRAQFGLSEIEERLVRVDPGFAEPSPTARLDSFFISERELKFTEHNAETPAGAGYSDLLGDIFYSLPVFQEFSRHHTVLPLAARPHVLHALCHTYSQWRGNRSQAPRIAILDWAEVPTVSEFRVFERYFRDRGLECRIVDPRNVEYINGSLRAGDFEFDLIYKRVLISELLERGGIDHPVVRGVLEGAACMVNGFRCKILYKKASLAVLSDERNRHLFTTTEAQAIADFIPWTRVVAERKTEFDGALIDLVPYILSHREHLLLKPNDEYGGKGIVLGWTVDASTWESAVRGALAEPFVVQERVNLPREAYPSWIDGRVQVIDRMLDTNPYCALGETMEACLTRISTEALVNVTAGGGSTVPTFLLDDR